MNTPDKPWSTQIRRTNIHCRSIRELEPSMASSRSLRRPERRTSPSSPINSGKLEALLRDHRKKIGSVRSKNCSLTNSRDGTYNVTYTQGGCADIVLHVSVPLSGSCLSPLRARNL